MTTRESRNRYLFETSSPNSPRRTVETERILEEAAYSLAGFPREKSGEREERERELEKEREKERVEGEEKQSDDRLSQSLSSILPSTWSPLGRSHPKPWLNTQPRRERERLSAVRRSAETADEEKKSRRHSMPSATSLASRRLASQVGASSGRRETPSPRGSLVATLLHKKKPNDGERVDSPAFSDSPLLLRHRETDLRTPQDRRMASSDAMKSLLTDLESTTVSVESTHQEREVIRTIRIDELEKDLKKVISHVDEVISKRKLEICSLESSLSEFYTDVFKEYEDTRKSQKELQGSVLNAIDHIENTVNAECRDLEGRMDTLRTDVEKEVTTEPVLEPEPVTSTSESVDGDKEENNLALVVVDNSRSLVKTPSKAQKASDGRWSAAVRSLAKMRSEIMETVNDAANALNCVDRTCDRLERELKKDCRHPGYDMAYKLFSSSGGQVAIQKLIFAGLQSGQRYETILLERKRLEEELGRVNQEINELREALASSNSDRSALIQSSTLPIHREQKRRFEEFCDSVRVQMSHIKEESVKVREERRISETEIVAQMSRAVLQLQKGMRVAALEIPDVG